MKVQRDRSFRCKCEMRARRERVSGILLKRESLPGANEVGGHDRGVHYLLSQHFVVPIAIYTAAVMLYHVSYDQNRSYEKCGAFRADL